MDTKKFHGKYGLFSQKKATSMKFFRVLSGISLFKKNFLLTRVHWRLTLKKVNWISQAVKYILQGTYSMCYYHPESCFLWKIFKKPMRKLLALRVFLIFENFFELFDFSVMREGNRLHAGEPPALHIASDWKSKADLGTWRSVRSVVRVKSVSRPCKVRVGCGRSVRAKPFRVVRG